MQRSVGMRRIQPNCLQPTGQYHLGWLKGVPLYCGLAEVSSEVQRSAE